MAGGGGDSFIAPLGLLLGLTAIVALLLSYAKQSTIIAFIIVGVCVNAFGTNYETETLDDISEVGILILLFMAGLEVELEAFIQKWKTVTIIAVGQIVCTTSFFALSSIAVLPAIGAEVTTNAAVYFGLCLCFSSTILVLGYLKNTKSMGTVYGQLCLGTLVLQDAASVLGIAVLSGLSTGVGTCKQAQAVDCQSVETAAMCMSYGSQCEYTDTTSAAGDVSPFLCVDVCASLTLDGTDDGGRSLCDGLGSTCVFQEAEGGGILASIAILFGKLVAACVICAILKRFVLEKMFEAFARSLELLYLGSLGYATGLAAIAVTAGFSAEITAFLAGVSLSQLPYKMHIETKMEPIKSLGVAIFFISLGLRLQLDKQMVNALPIGLGLAFFTLFATLPLFMLLGFLAKLKSHNVFMLGLLMNQISEFSLILCTLCVRAKVFEPIVLTVMTVAAVVSIIFSSIGHIFIDKIYQKMQRWWCLRIIDTNSRIPLKDTKENEEKDNTEIPLGSNDVEEEDVEDTHFTSLTRENRPKSLLRICPSGLEDEEWAFEDQLKDRSTKQLQLDLEKTIMELEKARKEMAATADEKKFTEKKKKKYHTTDTSTIVSHIETSDAADVMHGMIEGHVIVDQKMVFCTLRGGRMLFWREQSDIGQAPPISMWDVSGMTILNVNEAGVAVALPTPRNATPNKFNTIIEVPESPAETTDSESSQDDQGNLWEWTIVLGHINRHMEPSSIEDVNVKLTIHGLEDQSDHDVHDWQDALSVATAKLNPIVTRQAHIREELNIRRKLNVNTLSRSTSTDDRKSIHKNRTKIICIGYNEMFPAVLAMADAVQKDVIVVEYDPIKINTIKQLYSEEKRKKNYNLRMSGINSFRASKIEIEDAVGVERINGVKCMYADIHDPECWEELEMDQAFMLVSTMKGARHAEKALMKWLKKHQSDTVFIACTHNNVEAIKLYEAGAQFVLQMDALAMRSTRDFLMETVAKVGDCSQLLIAGQSHKKKLIKFEKEDQLKFQHETGL